MPLTMFVPMKQTLGNSSWLARQQRGSDDRQHGHCRDPPFARVMRAEPIGHDGQQGENTPLATVVGAHHEAGYLTVTAITSARSMSDTMPYKSATVALAPPAAIKLLQRV